MPVPASINELSTTASNNSPAGSESPITADDYLRAHASFIAQLKQADDELSSSTGTDHVGRGTETLEQSLAGIEADVLAIPLNVAARHATKAAFDAAKDTGENARIMEGNAASGDGAGGLFVKRSGDSVSPDDGVRSIAIDGGGRWRSMVHQQGSEVMMPAGFPFAPLVKAIRTPRGYAGHIDVRDLAPNPAGVTYYVDAQTGSDAAAGTSAEPLKSIQAALGKADVAVVKVAPAFYHRLEGWTSIYPSGKDFRVERWEGVRQGPVVVSTAESGLAWSANATYPAVFQAARSFSADVRDYSRHTQSGNPYRYRKTDSLAACAALQGSWYTDGTTVYVNTLEGGAPHREVKVVLNTACGYFNSASTVYVEGLEFHGGREAFYAQNGAAAGGLFIAKNCKFLYGVDGTYGNGLRLEGVAVTLLQGCEASFNTRDGFNYHHSGEGGARQHVVEINCRALYNGQEGNSDGINNASTMHDGGAIIRIGGEYAYSEGPNIADVNASQSVCIGASAHDSRLGSVDVGCADFYTSAGNMWLYDCEPGGSYYDCVQTTGGMIYSCLTPMRRTSGAPSYYPQYLGNIIA
jgi:hypothetical protein